MDKENLENVEWDVHIINQYAIEVSVEEVTVYIPVRETVAGETAFVPRDEDFDRKKYVRGIIQYYTDYLPVATPEARVCRDDKYFELSFEGEIESKD